MINRTGIMLTNRNMDQCNLANPGILIYILNILSYSTPCSSTSNHFWQLWQPYMEHLTWSKNWFRSKSTLGLNFRRSDSYSGDLSHTLSHGRDLANRVTQTVVSITQTKQKGESFWSTWCLSEKEQKYRGMRFYARRCFGSRYLIASEPRTGQIISSYKLTKILLPNVAWLGYQNSFLPTT